jgi:glycerophosphoryl diester phosphodiesterase
VVAHDPLYADGTRLADLSAAETDERGTLRLRALFDRLPPTTGVDVDLKSAMEDALCAPERTTAALLGPVVAEEAARRPLLVSSFDPAALQRVRCTAPQVPLGWLTWHRFPLETAVAGCAHLDVEVLGVHVGSLDRDLRAGGLDAAAAARTVALVHGCGRALMVWCPDPAPARVLVGAGVDAVVVDKVPQALGALRRVA